MKVIDKRIREMPGCAGMTMEWRDGGRPLPFEGGLASQEKGVDGPPSRTMTVLGRPVPPPHDGVGAGGAASP